jgi:hypothetical protein
MHKMFQGSQFNRDILGWDLNSLIYMY